MEGPLRGNFKLWYTSETTVGYQQSHQITLEQTVFVRFCSKDPQGPLS